VDQSIAHERVSDRRRPVAVHGVGARHQVGGCSCKGGRFQSPLYESLLRYIHSMANVVFLRETARYAYATENSASGNFLHSPSASEALAFPARPPQCSAFSVSQPTSPMRCGPHQRSPAPASARDSAGPAMRCCEHRRRPLRRCPFTARREALRTAVAVLFLPSDHGRLARRRALRSPPPPSPARCGSSRSQAAAAAPRVVMSSARPSPR
jgi:hypothetical protein